jgi:N4-gp56 family major capsid protein
MVQLYNAPPGTPSTIGGSQMNEFYWDRKSLIDAAEKMYFSPLADVKWMPMHYGKELKVYYYVPMLDDRNVNDQGIDAAGVVLSNTQYFVTFPRNSVNVANAGKAAAVTAINANTGDTLVATAGADDSGGTGFAAIALVGGLTPIYNTLALANAVKDLDIGVSVLQAGGNMYGSSKDVGTISARMPTLTEEGGRVNRVGFSRIERSGTIAEHGIFTEFTADSLTFDSDSELYSHMSHEMVAGANELTEDLLQIDLLSAAGVTVYSGVATQDSELTAEGADPSVVTYSDLKKLGITLDDNRTPKNTKVIKGSTMTDTLTVNSARFMYIGSELQTTVENMLDSLNQPAFIPVRKYADASNIWNGEIGTVADFRIIVVPNMMHWAGAGALEGTNPGYAATNGAYNLYPMLVVGDGSFATVGLQMSGRKGAKQKFKIIVKKPGEAIADRNDPYGKIGFSSITFYHGFITLRSERIAVVKTVAPE